MPRQNKRLLLESNMDNIRIKHWKIIAIIILPLGLVWIWFSSTLPGVSSNTGIPAPQVGFSAPEIVLQNSDGEEVMLSELRGQVVMVNFWASWCGPCTKEMPSMQSVYDEYHNLGFEILAVNTTYQDRISDADIFIEVNQLDFPILFDLTGEVSNDYNLYSTPMSFFIDKEGVIRNIIPGGPISKASLINNIETLLQEGD